MTRDTTEQKRKPVRAVQPGSPKSSWRQQQREAHLAKWRAVDWSKQDVVLAEEMGFSGKFIGDIRRRIGAPKSPRCHQYRSKFTEPNRAKWRSWDWSKQDAELARETGLSRERIRQIRQLLGAPRSPHHRRLPAISRQNTLALQWAADNLGRLRGLSAAELRRKYGFKQSGPVYEFLKAKGVLRDGRFIRKHRWDLMNFRLSNRDLERIWRLPRHMAESYRSRKRLGPATWSFEGGYPQFRWRGQLRAYHRAVKAEERKAVKYFAESGRL